MRDAHRRAPPTAAGALLSAPPCTLSSCTPFPQYAIFHDTPEVLDGYSHIAVWDDDVESGCGCEGPCGAINQMFATAERLNAWVSGPAFTDRSRVGHWNMVRNSLLTHCWTGFVEARRAARGFLSTAAAASPAACGGAGGQALPRRRLAAGPGRPVYNA